MPPPFAFVHHLFAVLYPVRVSIIAGRAHEPLSNVQLTLAVVEPEPPFLSNVIVYSCAAQDGAAVPLF